MNLNNDVLASRRVNEAFAWFALSPVPRRHARTPDDRSELNAIAEVEGWRLPPPEVARVVLRPWQQAVFWGLRVYILVMLAIVAIGFAQFAVGK
ncbi:MAG: hypothetical protein JO081_04105 [Alphaproteobacteria bacterium]|nr:hypothetical protein [Alphaproteobacteria bacterium]